MNYKHELLVGRTSSVAYQIIGFNKEGNQVLPERFAKNKYKNWQFINENSVKVINLIDLCGHEKYFKTTIKGMVSNAPDYAMIIVGSNQGISRMTQEHMSLCLALKIPFFIVLTKKDICPPNIYQQSKNQIAKYLTQANKKRLYMKNDDEIQHAAKIIRNKKHTVSPVFEISNVTREGIDELMYFLSQIKDRDKRNKVIKSEDDPIQFDIFSTYIITGAGIVVYGLMKSGTIKIGDKLLLGPNKQKQFKQVTIRSIHINRSVVQEAKVGQLASYNIKAVNKAEKLKRKDVIQGMSLISSENVLKTTLAREFIAHVRVMQHATSIKEGYNAVAHVGCVMQSVEIQEMKDTSGEHMEMIRTGDEAIVRFRFLYYSALVTEGLPILFREGSCMICGWIIEVFEEKEIKKQEEKD